eukprot:GHVL01004675.1.p2 GENE.GHVL01004675.1~~GHVL01004675.1.p2  ORF type:complete len:290 (-),score=63.29 GHVL01004675.1:1074-1943(-)
MIALQPELNELHVLKLDLCEAIQLIEDTMQKSDSTLLEESDEDFPEAVLEEFFQLQKSLTITPSTSVSSEFGKWEQYTKGFGSRMLAKMGYKSGGPLGRVDRDPCLGPVIVDPVPIRILPPGKSLDYIGQLEGRLPKKRGGKGGGVRGGRGEDNQSMKGDVFKMVKVLGSGPASIADAQDFAREENKKREIKHQSGLEEMRRGKKFSEKDLRKRLLDLQEEEKSLAGFVTEAQNHAARHSSSTGMAALQKTYTKNMIDKKERLSRLKSERIEIEKFLARQQNSFSMLHS